MFKEINFTCGACNSTVKKKVEISDKAESVLTIVCDECGSSKIMKITPIKQEVEQEKPLLAKKEKKVKGFGKEGWKNE